MTRKSGSKLLAAHNKNSSSGGPGGGAGYCEVCKVNYSWLEDHLSSVSHIKAVTDPTQYQELDSLISSSGWNGQRKSLRIKSPPPYSSPPTPTPLNCNGHINNHQTPLTNGTNIIRRSSDRKSPRRCRVSRKRLSAEEKLIEDNRAYYKVEVLNSKLRSTGTLQRQLGSSSCDSGEEENSNSSSNHMGSVLGATSLLNGQPNQPNEESVVVRLKKVRKSELSMLNDEAENFMFGDKKEDDDKTKRRDINNDTDYYKVELPSSRLRLPTSTKEEPQSRLKFNKSPPFDDSSSIRLRSAGGKSPPKEETVNHRLRSNKSPSDDHYRLRIKEEDKVNEVINHRLRSGGKSPKEEEQIHHRLRSSRHPEDDNRTSPETNHPRLRSGGGTPPPEPKLRSCPGLSPIKELTVERLCPPSEDDHCPEITLTHADITFAFELNNTEGVWSQVRDRLDNFKEELLPHHYSYPKVVLPAEMPYLERLKMLTRRRRRLSRCLDDKPRKSPRCHASTLAILSSVLPKSKLAEQPTSGVSSTPSSVNNPCPEDEETTASTMTVESNGSDSNTDSKALLQRFMQHFASLVDSAQPKATSPRPHETDESEELDINPSNMDFLEMLSNDDCPLMDTCVQESMFNLRSFDTSALDSCNSSDCSEIFGFSEDGRSCFGRRRKKKRHNLTGWPKEKPRRKFMAYARKPRFLKSEPSIIHTDVDTESSAVLENFVLSLNERRNEMSPNSKRRGRPRMYPPGMSPSSIRNKLARENVLRRSSSISPLKSKPSLKLHPL